MQPGASSIIEIRDDRIDRPALLLLLFERTVQDDTDGEDVIYPLERDVLLAHLVPDREDRLGAALDVLLFFYSSSCLFVSVNDFSDNLFQNTTPPFLLL